MRLWYNRGNERANGEELVEDNPQKMTTAESTNAMEKIDDESIIVPAVFLYQFASSAGVWRREGVSSGGAVSWVRWLKLEV